MSANSASAGRDPWRRAAWARLAAVRVAGLLPLDRIGQHLSLVAFVAAGQLLALVLILVVPLYADGVNSRLLQEVLRAPAGETGPRNHISLRHFSSIYGPINPDVFEPTDRYLRNSLQATVGIPTRPVQTFIYSEKLRLLPADLAGELGVDPIGWTALGFDESLPERIELIEGRLAGPVAGETIEVIASQAFVNKVGLRVGDQLVLRGVREQAQVTFDVELVGVWRSKTASVEGWTIHPAGYEEVFVVPRSVFLDKIAPRLASTAYYGLIWHAEFAPTAITVNNAARFRGGVAELQGRAARFLGGRLELESPDQALADFQSQALRLRTLLFIFSIPTILIVLLYIISTGNLFAERQRAEIVVLKGRGASRTQILGGYLWEGVILGLLPLLLGPFAAFGAAQLIGRTEGFLRFGPGNALPLRLTGSTAQLALGILAGALMAGMLPVLGAARQTLISYQQQVVRSTRRPLWQRLGLDVLVLLAAGYGYYTLRRQGTLLALGGPSGADPFSNPLSLLLPATALLGCSLLVVRVFPALTALLARLLQRVLGATTLLALRHLARAPEQGRSIVLLATLTLALGTFSASMATTLDQNDADRIMYATGGELRLSEQAERSRREERWTYPPAWEHGEVPGVAAWSRFRTVNVATTVGSGVGAGGQLIALDRAGYHAAGWWRSDLASASLGQLMNILAAEPQALIVNRGFLAASRLRIGDPVTLSVENDLGGGGVQTLEFIIRAVVDAFPTVYPQPGGYFFVGNYDYVHLRGDPVGYDLVLKLEPGADRDQVVAGLQQRGFTVDNVRDARELTAAARSRPERIGFVGLLSLGFVAAAGLTMLALLLYSLFSFRRRMVEIGVLRAAGLSLSQLIWLLAFELCFVTLSSALAGIALGVGAARLFVPFYQLGTTPEARTPSFVVVIAWDEIGRLMLILGGMLLVTLLLTTLLLRRLRIHEAIKLGQELG